MAQAAADHLNVLAVLQGGEARASLDRILTLANCQLQFRETLREARSTLQSTRVCAVVSEGRFSDGYGWKDLLREIQAMENPPALIVADRLADESLWAEVLNLGGYDLLVQPFEEREVLAVLRGACRQKAALPAGLGC